MKLHFFDGDVNQDRMTVDENGQIAVAGVADPVARFTANGIALLDNLANIINHRLQPRNMQPVWSTVEVPNDGTLVVITTTPGRRPLACVACGSRPRWSTYWNDGTNEGWYTGVYYGPVVGFSVSDGAITLVTRDAYDFADSSRYGSETASYVWL